MVCTLKPAFQSPKYLLCAVCICFFRRNVNTYLIIRWPYQFIIQENPNQDLQPQLIGLSAVLYHYFSRARANFLVPSAVHPFGDPPHGYRLLNSVALNFWQEVFQVEKPFVYLELFLQQITTWNAYRTFSKPTLENYW